MDDYLTIKQELFILRQSRGEQKSVEPDALVTDTEESASSNDAVQDPKQVELEVLKLSLLKIPSMTYQRKEISCSLATRSLQMLNWML